MKIEAQQRYFDDLQTKSLDQLIFMERKIERSVKENNKEDKLPLIRIAIEGKKRRKAYIEKL